MKKKIFLSCSVLLQGGSVCSVLIQPYVDRQKLFVFSQLQIYPHCRKELLSKGEPRHPVKESYFGRLYLRFCSSRR